MRVNMCDLDDSGHSFCPLLSASSGQGNRLSKEQSPYLLQHANNPVDWYPWGEEAFERARREGKPVLLSIGYSTCHWCHVMEEESFEDTLVARLMNEAFVSIKVDREERPDIDNVYMAACQMMTGSGGWPLTIIMTPDKKPFFAATYIPKDNRYGRTGMLELIPKVTDLWRNRRTEALQSAERVAQALSRDVSTESGNDPDLTTIHSAKYQLSARFDSDHGGFGSAPKFPIPHNLTLLLRHWNRTNDSSSLMMVEKTLAAMREGGIYDHIGFGFHRYSTDANWLVPHFEKMLYDQALLAIAYAEAYQATRKDEYAQTVREILGYVSRDMTSPQGAYWSAEDADSEGEEGKFYLWTISEVRSILDSADADLFIRAYNLTANGNFSEPGTRRSTGANIPHLKESISELAADLNISARDVREQLESIRERLFAARDKRIHPHKDDKVLTDWNGLMIAAYSKAAQVLDDSSYVKAASTAASFILDSLRTRDGRLVHRYRSGEASIDANLDDYAFLIWGLLELYEAGFDVRFLKAAVELTGQMFRDFWDDKGGGFYFTSHSSEKLLTRVKESYDGALPSGNSVAMLNLVRIARATGKTEFEDLAVRIGRAFSAEIWSHPASHCQMMQAVDFVHGPSAEIVVCGDPDAADTKRMLWTVRSKFRPREVLLLKPDSEPGSVLPELAEYTRPLVSISGKATVYVCRDFACQQPLTEPAALDKALGDQ
ncbi:MAG: thioredoxin domain-containing protein [Candidatus Zixiibacteriota bacterium]